MTVLECRVGFQWQADSLSLRFMNEWKEDSPEEERCSTLADILPGHILRLCLSECMSLPGHLSALNSLYHLSPWTPFLFLSLSLSLSLFSILLIQPLISSVTTVLIIAFEYLMVLLLLSCEVSTFCARQLA
ncbi:hypothetical protein M440DRAFT_191905 [Trichoderma longibrachiatum ATCC 18648]|uniref:Uncharacterized protein n=1 Tax=Trichoderma longibrachiatum ATCC 18648 TaxID=983965 RepID=A0A2T4CFM5_TRILO|nr:hypothetical protein M440DRAFT_191905 [Trichoderma longibrachiatum ATCC 18648]